MTSKTEQLSIKEKLKRNIYEIDSIPPILYFDSNDVYVNKDAPCPNEIECLENYTFEKVLVEKLKAKKVGCWQLTISKIKCEHFDSKDSLDKMFMDFEFQLQESPQICGQTIQRISIKNAIKLFYIDFLCNIDYYLTHQDEIVKDLNRDVDLKSILNNKIELKKLEQELFYNQMCKLIGEKDDANDLIQEADKANVGEEEIFYEKAYILNNFRILYADGNLKFATARRGQYYLLFYYLY